MFKIITAIILLLCNGYGIKYDHVSTAKSGYFEVYDPDGDCIAGDAQLDDLPTVYEEAQK